MAHTGGECGTSRWWHTLRPPLFWCVPATLARGEAAAFWADGRVRPGAKFLPPRSPKSGQAEWGKLDVPE